MASFHVWRIIWRTAAVSAILTACPDAVFGQTAMCEASLSSYIGDASLRGRREGNTVVIARGGVEYVCRCPSANQPPVCKPRESSGSGSGGGGGVDMSTFSPGQRVALVGIQALLNGIFSDPPKASSPPRVDPAVAAAEILRRQQEELKRQEDARLRLLEDWRLFQKAEKTRLMAEKDNREYGAKLSDKTMGTGGGQGAAFQPVSGGDLGFAGLSVAEMAKRPIGPDQQTTAAAHVRCAAWFSDKALEFSMAGNETKARFYSLQVQKAMIGEATDAPCEAAPTAPVNVPGVPAAAVKPDPAVDAVIEQYGVKIQELLDISQKLTEARQKKVKAAYDVKDTEARILDLKGRTATATDPGEKQQVDDLLAQALALKSESDARLKDAEAAEQSCLTDVRKTEDQVKELNAKLPAKKDSK